MKSNVPRFIVLALAIAVLLWWALNRKRDDAKPVAQTTASTSQAKPEPLPSAPVPTPVRASVPEKISAPSASSLSREAEQGFAHEKIRQWLRSKTGDTATQERLIEDFVAILTDENAAEILQSFSAQEFDTPFSTKALERWLAVDATKASQWIAARSDARDEHSLLVARRLMETPADLIAYSGRLPEGAWKENVLDHASLEMIAKSPTTAISFADHLAPGDRQTNAYETIAYDWFGRDLSAATQWVQTVQDAQLRERLLAVGAKAIANADPDLAAGWLVSSVKTEGVLNATALSVLETWADKHPTEAGNWVARFPDSGPRKEAIDLLLNHWLKTDPASANAWIQTLPEREAVMAKLKAEEAERAKAPEKE